MGIDGRAELPAGRSRTCDTKKNTGMYSMGQALSDRLIVGANVSKAGMSVSEAPESVQRPGLLWADG